VKVNFLKCKSVLHTCKFTCMEMKDEQQPGRACCGPELLVREVKAAAKKATVELAGENGLERHDESAFSQRAWLTRISV